MKHLQIKVPRARMLLTMLCLLFVGVGQMWADIYLKYMADMPSSWWTPSTSVTMNQSSINTNRYYYEVSLTSGTTYGFCIYEGSDIYKANVTATSNEKVQLYKYKDDGTHRVSYTPSSTGTHIFTYDSGTKEIYVGPKSGETIKIAYDVASGHDSWSNLSNYTNALTESGENYYIDIDLTAAKYYMFVQIKLGNNSYAYWRGSSAITIDGDPVSVYHYESNAFTQTDKINFTPSAAGKYRFTWNHRYKTIKIQRLYKVTYDANGGTGTKPADSYHLSGSTVTAASNSGPISKSNYSFSGWNSNNSGSGTDYAAGSGTFTMPSSTKTLYAKWTQTVTLGANTSNGGSGADGSATATWNRGELISISHPSGATGYTRTGYFTAETGGTKVLNANGTYAGSAVTGYITSSKWSRTGAGPTLHAQWTNQYAITFDEDGATTSGTENTTATYGSAMPEITVPSKTGYIFGGYYTGTNGSGTQYYNADGTSATNWNLTAATTLHAKWTGITYHVAFAGNGATSGSMSDQSHTYGSSKALTTNAYARTGYYFLGWNTNADGSGTKFYDGKSVTNLTTTPGETVTLHAQWAQTHTLYFLNMGTSGWDQTAPAGSTTRYAYAFISYDGHKLEPIGAYSKNSSQGTRMTATSSISLPNVSGGTNTWCWSIAGVPDGATIIFSDNTDSHKTGDLSGWTADKPYYCNGNGTWYALDGTNQIKRMTNMSVHIGEGDFGSWKYFALDKYDDGAEGTYAIINLNKDQTYQYKYSNWFNGGESGSPDNDAYIINGSSTTYDYGGFWAMNGSKNILVKTNSHASGEYKFVLKPGATPETKVYIPRGVNLTTTSPTEAKVGESVTVSFQADAWTNIGSDKAMSHPTYYFEFSTDESNWTTVATASPTSSQMQGTATYTFAAQSGYFRVKLVNDNGIASWSGSTAFSTYTTKSFYVYNPWNNSSDKWQYLELYTWNGGTTYNGNLGDCYISASASKGTHATGCLHGNDVEALGNNWFKITIDERANNFVLAGNKESDNYAGHKTGDLSVSGYIPDAKYMLINDGGATLKEYKAKGASDYRLIYTPSGGSARYSEIYNTTLDGTTVTTSMWMNASIGGTLIIQQATGSDTWANKVTYTNSSNGFDGIVPSDKRDKGYVFQMQLNINTGTPTSSTITNVAEYTGPYYVRTDGLDGGWNVYKTSKHIMHHNEASLNGTPAYNYYLCKWIGSASTNVKFTVANDYNKELVASLEGDANSTDPLYNRQTIPTATNVRFSYNSHTNTLTRAYLSAAQEASSRFLVLVETTDPKGKIYKADGVEPTGGNKISGLNNNELIFEDKGNWVYQLTMKANPGAAAAVTAKYNNKEQAFIPSVELIDGSQDTKYTYRIVYDFKTNVLTNAWIPDGSAVGDINLNTNAMLIRNGQGAATQITFTASDKSITHAKKLIGVMQFDYDNMVGKMGSWNSQAYQYCMYYISFPFDVNVSDIFGVGTYGTDWKLQYYDGAERAEKGFYRGDGTTTFWKDVPASGTLDKHVGYSLLLNRIKFNNGSSDIWENKTSGSSVYLYFPSTTDVGTISQVSADIAVPAHYCTKGAFSDGQDKSHNNTDSHWNMIGVPVLANEATDNIVTFLTGEGTEENFRHLYVWDYSDNSLSVSRVTGSFTFHAMKSYMVQFHGHITFSGAGIPASVAARRAPSNRNYNIELQVLNADDQMINHAYVSLEEGADADFALNEDLYMNYNNRAVNVYTFAGSYDVAANVLPIANATIPVGVTVKTVGTYTFHMPDNFSGTVTLVDNELNTRTNLALYDYEITLPKGTCDGRFALEIGINNAPTSIDVIEEGSSLNDGKAHKFIQNGVMYILRDGVIYDAQGVRVK